jgi:hypothetical protein
MPVGLDSRCASKTKGGRREKETASLSLCYRLRTVVGMVVMMMTVMVMVVVLVTVMVTMVIFG